MNLKLDLVLLLLLALNIHSASADFWASVGEFAKQSTWIFVAIILGIVLIFVLMISLCCFCFSCFCFKRRRKERTTVAYVPQPSHVTVQGGPPPPPQMQQHQPYQPSAAPSEQSDYQLNRASYYSNPNIHSRYLETGVAFAPPDPDSRRSSNVSVGYAKNLNDNAYVEQDISSPIPQHQGPSRDSLTRLDELQLESGFKGQSPSLGHVDSGVPLNVYRNSMSGASTPRQPTSPIFEESIKDR
jgi:hypothetical protein